MTHVSDDISVRPKFFFCRLYLHPHTRAHTRIFDRLGKKIVLIIIGILRRCLFFACICFKVIYLGIQRHMYIVCLCHTYTWREIHYRVS